MAPQPENRPFSVEKMKFFKNGWTEKENWRFADLLYTFFVHTKGEYQNILLNVQNHA